MKITNNFLTKKIYFELFIIFSLAKTFNQNLNFLTYGSSG